MVFQLFQENCLLILNIIIFNFVSPSLQNTHYADENASLVVQSVTLCHLYGDLNIYGISICVSFYLTWLTLFIAVALHVKDEIKNTCCGFNVVALAVLINTYKGVLDGNFAVLEIFIVASLVIILSIYFLISFGAERFGTINPFDTSTFRADPVGIGILLLIDAFFLLTQPWLYFVVLRKGSKPICNARIWIFKPVSLLGSTWT